MPRSNRPKGRRTGTGEDESDDLSRMLAGWRRTEMKRDGVWHVQPISAAQAAKTYLCPGCQLDINPGVAHIVTWRGDGVTGDAADLAARRHWHLHCWKIK
ncbi:hypothetical protein E3T61_06600 [Cryobacterium lactosi]|uniref:ATP/GTP-binding protein n=1 Tax=Cryobacterium lactosi TaxID=1259202 RepID=A0A4R9BVW1_9MICO|nr:hypothetical protein [Cryobacterium lactosi]TFD91984.1 hypothetical protein E3T61_06600 [Cryobacterium lactosi]